MKRRDILKNITLGLAVTSTGMAQTRPIPKPKLILADAAGGRLKSEIEHDQKLKAQQFFTSSEMALLTVLVDIIIPADAKSGSASQAGVPAFIEFIAKDMPQHQTPLRGGLAWLNQQAVKRHQLPFVKISNNQQLAIVDLIAYPKAAKPEHSQGVSFFNLLRNLTATGFFTSTIGLADLGYQGNKPNKWEGVPDEVLKKYNLSYDEWETHKSL